MLPCKCLWTVLFKIMFLVLSERVLAEPLDIKISMLSAPFTWPWELNSYTGGFFFNISITENLFKLYCWLWCRAWNNFPLYPTIPRRSDFELGCYCLATEFPSYVNFGSAVDGWSSLNSDVQQANLNDLQRQMSACYFMPVYQEGKTASVQAVLFWVAYVEVRKCVLHLI